MLVDEMVQDDDGGDCGSEDSGGGVLVVVINTERIHQEEQKVRDRKLQCKENNDTNKYWKSYGKERCEWISSSAK